jgi:hypothetical protein
MPSKWCIARLTPRNSHLPSPCPAHRGRLRRRARVGAGCGVLRVWLVTRPPGGVRATPPFRHYERNVRMHPCRTKGHAHVHRPEDWPRRARSQKIAAVERRRRASPARGLRKRFARDARASDLALRAYVTGPRRVPRKHPSASRRSASLVRAREHWQASEDIHLARTMTRAQSIVVCPVEFAPRLRSLLPGNLSRPHGPS